MQVLILFAALLQHVLLSITVLIFSLWGSLRLCGRIFRIGILMYGKKPTLLEVAKWTKYS